jgi:hypothetical protein
MPPKRSRGANPPISYQVIVRGELSRRYRTVFEGTTRMVGNAHTAIMGRSWTSPPPRPARPGRQPQPRVRQRHPSPADIGRPEANMANGRDSPFCARLRELAVGVANHPLWRMPTHAGGVILGRDESPRCADRECPERQEIWPRRTSSTTERPAPTRLRS